MKFYKTSYLHQSSIKFDVQIIFLIKSILIDTILTSITNPIRKALRLFNFLKVKFFFWCEHIDNSSKLKFVGRKQEKDLQECIGPCVNKLDVSTF